MDNIIVPRPLIYYERRSLEEFTDHSPLNETLVDNMSNVYYLKKRFKERALRCMNSAFYICTLILREKHPEWSFDSYCDLAYCDDKNSKVNQAVTLSLICIYLDGLDEEHRQKLQKLKLLLDDFMSLRTNYLEMGDPFLQDYNYIDVLKQLRKGLTGYTVDENTFSFRFIDKEAVRDVMAVKDFNWIRFVDYYRESSIRELVDYYGKTEEEKHNIVEILRQAANGFYTAGYGKYEEVEILLNDIDNEIHLRFNKESEQSPSKNGISDPGLNEARVKELESILSQKEIQIMELETMVENLQKTIEDAHTIPDTVTAQQRVRMELARKLMEAAGINDSILKNWGNKDKAGTLMGTLLDIVPSTCKTYLSDPSMNRQHHEKTVTDINKQLEALGVGFKL